MAVPDEQAYREEDQCVSPVREEVGDRAESDVRGSKGCGVSGHKGTMLQSSTEKEENSANGLEDDSQEKRYVGWDWCPVLVINEEQQ